jgi:hypothetical protein
LANSEAKLAETRRAAEQTQERLRSELQKADEMRQALGRAELQAASARGEDSKELQRLQRDAAAAQQHLAERNAELERLRLQSESLRNEVERRCKDAVVEAERHWKSGEKNRLAAAEAQWKKEFARELADATARFETAERTLSQLRIRNSARDAGDNAEVVRLRDELAALQASIGTHKQESWDGGGGPAQEAPIVLRTNRDWERLDETRVRRKRRNIAGSLVATALIAAAIALYMGAQSLGPQFSLANLSPVFGGTPVQPSAQEKHAAVVDNTPKAVLTHGANVRSGPSTTGAVIASVTRGAEVSALEQQGKWTHIRLADQRDGWVFSEFLERQEKGGSSAPAPKAR